MSNEADLHDLVARLAARVDQLTAEVADLKKKVSEDIPEDTLIAIAAAVAAYTGYKGKVRAVRFRASRNYARTSIARAQDHRVR